MLTAICVLASFVSWDQAPKQADVQSKMSTVVCSCAVFNYRCSYSFQCKPRTKSFDKSQWLKCKIRGEGTLHSGLGPWQWSCAFS